MSIILRVIEGDDLRRGYFDLLSQLTVAPCPERGEFLERVDLIAAHGIVCVVLVDSEKDLIVGTSSLIVEPKMIRGLSFVGHIEDVAVHRDYQGRRLGHRLVEHLCAVARERGCYKVILDADEKNGPFYEKCGFRRKESQYRLDL
jgi:glucosamine-phosphate N-acetyltransferase